MIGTKSSLANHGRHSAHTAAWLSLGLAALPFVPVPAILIALADKSLKMNGTLLPRLLHFVVSVTPTFALPAFLLGCMVGAAVHLQVNSAERIGALEAGRYAAMGTRPIVASCLVVGAVFAATGLVLAAVWPGMI